MGTGKTTVGKILARRLGYTFVDSDDVIEQRAGVSIPEIFAKQGEKAFRRMETAIITELAHERKMVIATGGGVVINPDNLLALKNGKCLIFVLRASIAEIITRTNGSNRPLLQGDRSGLSERIKVLLDNRQALYDAAGLQINTSHKNAEEVADEILRLLRGGMNAR